MSRLRKDSTSILVPADEIRYGPILIVEDDRVFARVLSKRLMDSGFQVEVATDGAAAIDVIRKHEPDVVITDWMMPRLDGIQLVSQMREDPRLRYVYVIMLSSRTEKRAKIQGLEAGADDFLPKDCDAAELVARVQAGMRIRMLQRALLRQASIDGMTGLLNRTHFFEQLQTVIQRAVEQSTPTTLVMIDLDNLKVLNDKFGHVVGDEAIRRVAEAMKTKTRAGDVAARYGGDEFALLISDATDGEAQSVMDRILDYLAANPLVHAGETMPITISYGMSTVGASMTGDDLIRDADAKLYGMKHLHHEMVALSKRAHAEADHATPGPSKHAM